MDKKGLYQDITYDIEERGMYRDNPRLKVKLQKLASKLLFGHYVINAPKLNVDDMNTLKENGYYN